ncbi:MAG: hypothetical protein JXQ71_05990 [Verrucomicrobia bacterium]|nr:hypothetical protein [Verrucomicrobiota bacterium]
MAEACPVARVHFTITEDDEGAEQLRRIIAGLVPRGLPRERIEPLFGQTWDTSQMAAEFEPLAFAAPYVVGRRRSDGKLGSMLFQHHPRYYFRFEEDR